MLKHLSATNQFDPFHFSSSSPEKAAPRSYVATRPNPYTVKSQNTFYHASLRTTAQNFALDPRLTAVNASASSTSLQNRPIDGLYTSLEAASSSPRCSSKPQNSPVTKYPALTMVKPKARPVQSLNMSVEMAATKRSSYNKAASAAASKRHRNVAEAAKQHGKSVTVSTHAFYSPRSSSRSPVLLSSSFDSAWPTRRAVTRESKPKLVIPTITVRSPTPESEPVPHQADQEGSDGSSALNIKATPVYMSNLLTQFSARINKVEDGIDSILSKYFDIHKSTHPIGQELLRYIAEHICKLYCCIEQPESELGQLKLRAISSHFFQHTVTGFFHLLDDPLAPYATASRLAFVLVSLLRDFDVATLWCCSEMEGPISAQQKLKHGHLFLNVLKDELNKILDRGIAMTDLENKLTLQDAIAIIQEKQSEGTADGGKITAISPGSSAWRTEREMRKQRAREGDKANEFVSLPVVRFIGQLVLHRIVSVQLLAKWLDRFLFNTVFVGIPSAWEIECACALVLTVGPILDQVAGSTDSAWPRYGDVRGSVAASDTPPSSCSDHEGEKGRSRSNTLAGDKEGVEILDKALRRIDELIEQQDLSPQAHQWLVDVRSLREQGWKYPQDDLDPADNYFLGNSSG